MNCEQSKQHYLKSQIDMTDTSQQKIFDEHISSCAACQAYISADEKLIEALRGFPVEAAPERLLDNAMQQVAINQKLKRYKTTNIGFGLALAASLFVALIMPGAFNLYETSGSDPLSTITMSMNTQRTINIVFDSPEAVADATITISLPENIRLAGYENNQEIQWNTKLNAGKNTLKLPLIANNTGKGLVHSTLEINGKSKKITLLVDVSSGDLSTNIINSATT